MLRINDRNELLVFIGPGGIAYSRLRDGMYRFGYAALRACSMGSSTPEAIAERLWTHHAEHNPPEFLERLGWGDVLELYREKSP